MSLPAPYFQRDGITIYHGDCRELLPEIHADAVITDPPYGVGQRYGHGYVDDPATYWQWFLPTVEAMRRAAPVVAFTHTVTALQRLTDWAWVGCWYKPMAHGARIGNSPLLPHWEPIFLYGVHTLGVHHGAFHDVIVASPVGNGIAGGMVGRARRAVAYSEQSHVVVKPVEVFRHLVAGLTESGQTVIDPFAGSGTTLRAAADLGRRAIGIEVNEAYCEIAARRLDQQVLPLDLAEGVA